MRLTDCLEESMFSHWSMTSQPRRGGRLLQVFRCRDQDELGPGHLSLASAKQRRRTEHSERESTQRFSHQQFSELDQRGTVISSSVQEEGKPNVFLMSCIDSFRQAMPHEYLEQFGFSRSSSLEFVICNAGDYFFPTGSVAESIIQCVLFPGSSFVCFLHPPGQ